MENGKCEDCGKPTNPMRKGGFFDKCQDCYGKDKAKQATLPVKSAQEEAGEIHEVFQMFVALIKAVEPKIDAQLAYQTALGLTQQFWSNARTPGGLNR